MVLISYACPLVYGVLTKPRLSWDMDDPLHPTWKRDDTSSDAPQLLAGIARLSGVYVPFTHVAPIPCALLCEKDKKWKFYVRFGIWMH